MKYYVITLVAFYVLSVLADFLAVDMRIVDLHENNRGYTYAFEGGIGRRVASFMYSIIPTAAFSVVVLMLRHISSSYGLVTEFSSHFYAKAAFTVLLIITLVIQWFVRRFFELWWLWNAFVCFIMASIMFSSIKSGAIMSIFNEAIKDIPFVESYEKAEIFEYNTKLAGDTKGELAYVKIDRSFFNDSVIYATRGEENNMSINIKEVEPFTCKIIETDSKTPHVEIKSYFRQLKKDDKVLKEELNEFITLYIPSGYVNKKDIPYGFEYIIDEEPEADSESTTK